MSTSKWRLAFEDLPVPADFPDFPHHSQILAYLRQYRDHFGLGDTITYNTEVTRAHREADGRWRVSLSTGETRDYDALIVANGHHWDPRWPDPYPGHFDGLQMHAHDYRTPFEPHDMRGKAILVVGAGNSAMDIASELSQRPIARRLFLSTRRGVHVLPKYLNGKPADKSALPAWVPLPIGRWLARQVVGRAVGRMEDYGLPKPDHKLFEAHPSVSGEFLTRVGCGDIAVRPGIARFEGNTVHFTDGSAEAVDVIIYATGYRISFPFFDQPDFSPDADNRLPLFKRMVLPGVDNLFYMGLAQPLPTLVNFPEQQSKLVAACLAGRYALPDSAEMRRIIARDERQHLGHFYQSPRHTIQVDFNHYVADLNKEIRRGEQRARARGIRPRAA